MRWNGSHVPSVMEKGSSIQKGKESLIPVLSAKGMGRFCVEMAFPWMLKSLKERLEREDEAFRKYEEDDYTDIVTHSVRKYGKEIGKWVSGKLLDKSREDGFICVDNERICEVGNPEDMVAYERRRETGCCGFHDEEIDHSSGRKFFIGFNHGH